MGDGNASRSLSIRESLQCVSQNWSRLKTRRAVVRVGKYTVCSVDVVTHALEKKIRLMLGRCTICNVRNTIGEKRLLTTLHESLVQLCPNGLLSQKLRHYLKSGPHIVC